MKQIVLTLIVCLLVTRCANNREEVKLSMYSYGMNLVLTEKLYLTVEKENTYTKYIFYQDSSQLYVAPSVKSLATTDSLIYVEDTELRLVETKQFQVDDSTYEVLKYEDHEKEMTLFFNEYYGPIILRGNHYKGHSTWDRIRRKDRLLIDIIRNDSVDFGGI